MYTQQELREKVKIVDIETTGLELDSRIHVLSCRFWDNNIQGYRTQTFTDMKDILYLFEDPENIIVGHYFKPYDIRVIETNYPDLEVKAFIIDTLPLSQYLFDSMEAHGLEFFGMRYRKQKTAVEKTQWQGLTDEQYNNYIKLKGKERTIAEENVFKVLDSEFKAHQALMIERCERDVLINEILWNESLDILYELYEDSDEDVNRIITKTNFKQDLLVMQANNPIPLDVEHATKSYDALDKIVNEKKEELESIMPDIEVIGVKNKPKTMTKKDGSLSVAGQKWIEFLKEYGIDPKDAEESYEYVSGHKPPNAGSHVQLKDLLFSLGWEPRNFKDGANGPVPQVMIEEDGVKVVCPSIKVLFKDHPKLEALDGLTVAKHRFGIVKGMLERRDENDCVTASYSGITNTFRVKHSAPLVNMPSNNAKYGEYIRKNLIAPKGYKWMNADLSSLEDKTKQCCIYDLDPDYVDTLNVKGYDAHLNLALIGGFMTPAEVDFFKYYKKLEKEDKETLPDIHIHCPEYSQMNAKDAHELYEKLGVIRQMSKTTNYSCTYGAGAQKIADTAEIPLSEGKKLWEAYWEMNWSVKAFANALPTKEVKKQKYVWSPFTKMWLPLRADHMKFSVVNQNFGATVFDVWAFFMIKRGYNISMSMHDEFSVFIPDTDEAEAQAKIDVAETMDQVNAVFNQPIKFSAEPEFAYSYGDVH